MAKPSPWAWDPASVDASHQSIAQGFDFLIPFWTGSGDPEELVNAYTPASNTGLTWETTPRVEVSMTTASTPELTYGSGSKPQPTTAFTFLTRYQHGNPTTFAPIFYDSTVGNHGPALRFNGTTGLLRMEVQFTTFGNAEVNCTTPLVVGDVYSIFMRWDQSNDLELIIYDETNDVHFETVSVSGIGADTIRWSTGSLWFFRQEGQARHLDGNVDFMGYGAWRISDAEITTHRSDPYGFLTQAGGGADTTPDAYDVPDRTGLEPSTSYDSTAVAITGIDSPTTVTLTGANVTDLLINGTPQGALTGSVNSGDTIAVRMTTSASYSTGVTANIDVGGVLDTTTFTTRAADTTPDAFDIPDKTAQEPSQSVTSDAVAITGIETGVSVTVTGDASDLLIDGVSQGGLTGTVNNGETVAVVMTTSASYETAVTSTVDVGGVQDTVAFTTRAADTTPDAFSIPDRAGLDTSTQYDSTAITVSGIETSVSVTVTGDADDLLINGTPQGQLTGTVNDGDTVAVRMTTSAVEGESVTATVDIGGVQDTTTFITAITIDVDDTSPIVIILRRR